MRDLGTCSSTGSYLSFALYHNIKAEEKAKAQRYFGFSLLRVFASDQISLTE